MAFADMVVVGASRAEIRTEGTAMASTCQPGGGVGGGSVVCEVVEEGWKRVGVVFRVHVPLQQGRVRTHLS